MSTLVHTNKTSFDNTPNLKTDNGSPFSILTSFDANIFESDSFTLPTGVTREAGYGSWRKRDIATDLVLYKPYDTALDTLVQLIGGFETTETDVHEWSEEDLLWDDSFAGVADTNTPGTSVINHTGFTAATTGYFTLAENDAAMIKVGDRVRYVAGTTAATYSWKYGLVTAIGAADSGGTDKTRITLSSVDFNSSEVAGNFTAGSATAVLQVLDSVRGSDYNYSPQPRGSVSKMYRTYLHVNAYDVAYTLRAIRTKMDYVDLVARNEAKLFRRMRYGREVSALYSKQGYTTMTNADSKADAVFLGNGIYPTISGYNKDTAQFTTNGSFDANKFINAMNDWIAFNFGGESGGPKVRTVFHSAKMGDYLGRAFESHQRFTGREYVAGIHVYTWDHPLGRVEFVHLPILDYKHPLPDGSMRDTNPRAVAIMLPVADCITRLTLNGEGPASFRFMLNGGDREEYMRVTSTEGMKFKLKQYTSVLEETL